MSDELVEWMCEIGSSAPSINRLVSQSEIGQREAGYFHTLREISQQPITWAETAARISRQKSQLGAVLAGTNDGDSKIKAVMITGSGSSLYAGECLAPALQRELRLPVSCAAGGEFLTQGPSVAPPCRPCLLVSLARSGDSPESCGAVDRMLQADDQNRHLIITCNERGKLANSYRHSPRVSSLVLNDRTNDRSLVMTSSFTNMVVAARFLGILDQDHEYCRMANELGRIARNILLRYTEPLAKIARGDIPVAVFLGSGCSHGAARESSLKLLEMSGGRVKSFAETFLGLRHGPMAIVHQGTLVVCFLSSVNPARAYELDLIRELDRKNLGARKIIVGEDIPGELVGRDDLGVECTGLGSIGDINASLIGVLIGQILGFFKCLALGLQPDSPSSEGVISRVVGAFPVY